MPYLILFCVGFLVSSALLFFLQKQALRHHILSKAGMPYVGGMAIGISFLAFYSIFFSQSGLPVKEAAGIILASSAILISGIIDDFIELSVPAKFLCQLAASLLLIFCGIRTHIVYIGDLGNILITLVWVIGITNALNHLDVLDGLAAGAAAISSLTFFCVAIINGDPRSSLLSLLLIAVTLPFLLYNLPPARMYMGNAGSHFLGFLMASCALLISYAPLERKVALLTPLLILGLPVFDTAFLIFVRLKQGRSAFKKSDDHMALRYLKQGCSKSKALFLILLLGLFLALCAVLVSQVRNLYAIMIFAFATSVCLLVAQRMNRVC
jgi:UDP-GlcNAc:undecaprenyl-phosphate/decaprenyl-phosphate GlcNAc-1-phosphate transferase